MKNILLVLALITSISGFGQRKLLAGTTRYTPKMENQKIENSEDEDPMEEYRERDFQGAEEDTEFLQKEMEEMEALKKGKITDPEREVYTFEYDKIFYTDMRDFKKTENKAKKNVKKK